MLIPLEEVEKLPGDLWKVNDEVFVYYICFYLDPRKSDTQFDTSKCSWI